MPYNVKRRKKLLLSLKPSLITMNTLPKSFLKVGNKWFPMGILLMSLLMDRKMHGLDITLWKSRAYRLMISKTTLLKMHLWNSLTPRYYFYSNAQLRTFFLQINNFRLIHGFVDIEDISQLLVDIVFLDTLNLEKMEMQLLQVFGIPRKDKFFEMTISLMNNLLTMKL